MHTQKTFIIVFNWLIEFLVLVIYRKRWINCPPNYAFTVGEKVKSKPFFPHNNGKIKCFGNEMILVDWHKRKKSYTLSYVFDNEILIERKFLIKKDKMRIKYLSIDPYGEENWSE